VDLTQTALREAREELGITRVELLGRLSSIPVYTSDHRLEPVVGLVEDAVLDPDPAEVAAVYEVSLRSILQRRFIRAVPWQWGDRQWLSPVFDIEGERLYGATAHSFLELLRVIAPLVGIPVPCLQTGGMQWADLLSGSSEALR
jgi:8-oxo-dGTP pyrophosphatase MutT (NUDIX family)